jgi:hypothetical protein
VPGWLIVIAIVALLVLLVVGMHVTGLMPKGNHGGSHGG